MSIAPGKCAPITLRTSEGKLADHGMFRFAGRRLHARYIDPERSCLASQMPWASVVGCVADLMINHWKLEKQRVLISAKGAAAQFSHVDPEIETKLKAPIRGSLCGLRMPGVPVQASFTSRALSKPFCGQRLERFIYGSASPTLVVVSAHRAASQSLALATSAALHSLRDFPVSLTS